MSQLHGGAGGDGGRGLLPAGAQRARVRRHLPAARPRPPERRRPAPGARGERGGCGGGGGRGWRAARARVSAQEHAQGTRVQTFDLLTSNLDLIVFI